MMCEGVVGVYSRYVQFRGRGTAGGEGGRVEGRVWYRVGLLGAYLYRVST